MKPLNKKPLNIKLIIFVFIIKFIIMSGGGGSIVIVSILYKINSQYHKNHTYNNEILQQKEAINKICSICENLSISIILVINI
jgi:hypothetical protein